MIFNILHGELIETKVLLTLDRTQLVATVDENLAGRDTAIGLLERAGFTRGSGSLLKLPLHGIDLKQLGDRLLGMFGGTIAWDLGNVFSPTIGAPPIDNADLPTFWGGVFVLHVRMTGHCLLFDREIDPGLLARCYYNEYRDYLSHEFHPGE